MGSTVLQKGASAVAVTLSYLDYLASLVVLYVSDFGLCDCTPFTSSGTNSWAVSGSSGNTGFDML